MRPNTPPLTLAQRRLDHRVAPHSHPRRQHADGRYMDTCSTARTAAPTPGRFHPRRRELRSRSSTCRRQRPPARLQRKHHPRRDERGVPVLYLKRRPRQQGSRRSTSGCRARTELLLRSSNTSRTPAPSPTRACGNHRAGASRMSPRRISRHALIADAIRRTHARSLRLPARSSLADGRY
jgi:hypothetical protein